MNIYVTKYHEKRYYKMLKPVGHCSIKGYEHYALWQPVKKILGFWFECGKEFYLDDYGFEKVK